MSKTPFADDTVYTHSYYEHDVCENRQKPIMQKDHLVMAGKFQDKTSQRVSEVWLFLSQMILFYFISMTKTLLNYRAIHFYYLRLMYYNYLRDKFQI